MKCSICQAKWILGNVSPAIEKCPICGVSFDEHPEDRNYNDIYELIHVLFLEKDKSFFSNTNSFNAYLNDYFPYEEELRELAKNVFTEEVLLLVYDCVSGNLLYQDIEDRIESYIPSQYENIKDFILFLCGHPQSNGTVFDENYYLDYATTSFDEKYKLVALKKAIQKKNDEEIILKIIEVKRKVKDNTWESDVENIINSNNDQVMFKLYEIYKDENKNDKSIMCLTKAAELNSIYAKYRLGKEFIIGKRISRDMKKGYGLIKDAADGGNAEAQYLMYSYYLNKNESELSRKYLGMAVSSDYEQAIYEYAIHLLYGDLVTANVDKSIKILEACANRGHKDSIIELIFLYSSGYKVNKDMKRTVFWKERLNGVS